METFPHGRESNEDPESLIASAQNIDSLYEILGRIDPIQGSSQTYSAEDIKNMIEPARALIASGKFGAEGIPQLPLVTRAFGLREKVHELLNEEFRASKGASRTSPKSSESSPGSLEDRLDKLQSFDELSELFKETLNDPKDQENMQWMIDSIRKGSKSVYMFSKPSNFPLTLNRLLWTDPSQDRSVKLVDTAYVSEERPWAICVNWVYDGTSQGHAGGFAALSIQDADFLREEAERMISGNYQKYPGIEDFGINGGVRLIVRDRGGREWEVVYGLRQGSSMRPGISRIRPV